MGIWPFDPSAYRNIGDAGGPVSSSQVTALIVNTGDESPAADYRVNLRGSSLAASGSDSPGRVYSGKFTPALKAAAARANRISAEEWIGIVSDIRSIAPSAKRSSHTFFEPSGFRASNTQ